MPVTGKMQDVGKIPSLFHPLNNILHCDTSGSVVLPIAFLARNVMKVTDESRTSGDYADYPYPILCPVIAERTIGNMNGDDHPRAGIHSGGKVVIRKAAIVFIAITAVLIFTVPAAVETRLNVLSPVVPDTVENEPQTALRRGQDVELWYVGLELASEDGAALDTYNRAGVIMSGDLEAGFFNAPDMVPPGRHVRLYLKDPDNPGRGALAYDFRDPGLEAYRWEIVLSTNYASIDARFSLTGIERIPMEFSLSLIDGENGSAREISEDTSFDLTLTSDSVRNYILTVSKRTAPLVESERPGRFGITSVSPNPFNPATVISFTLGRAGNTAVTVYNTNGQLAARLYEGSMDAGPHRLEWYAGGRASGVYIVQVESGGMRATRTVTVMKYSRIGQASTSR